MVTNGQTTTEAVEIIAAPIPVALIVPSPLNRHCEDSDSDIAELAQTILENGLLSPISARPMDGGNYEIICGERRWRAFRLLEWETIPCIVKDLDDAQAQIERIIENYQRRDPSFMEQGEAVVSLLDLTDRDVSEVANRLGQSVSWVRRRAKLPNLISAWREELEKDNTPYYTIRDTVSGMEELAILPAATQKIILDSGVLRYVKTTKEIRSILAKHFMSLDAKPWTRLWEKKAFSGSGKKRCDACLKRSDRENALFADPNAPDSGAKMCLDPQCWKNKCLSWCKSLIEDNPGMVPIRQGYGWNGDTLGEYFSVKPLSRHDWHERDDPEAEEEGYTAAVGVFVDGPDIGTTRDILLELLDVDDDSEDSDIAEVHNWRNDYTTRFKQRDDLAKLIAADITEYLTNISDYFALPTAILAERKIRAAAWFGITGYADSEEPAANLADPDWNPLSWAWNQTISEIATHIAAVKVEDIARLNSGNIDATLINTAAATLIEMFALPIDVIATRATERLYASTHNKHDEDDSGAEQENTITFPAVDLLYVS